METIMKIPFLLAIIAAILTGIFCMVGNKDLNQTCTRMIIAMISFYIVGLFARSTLKSIIEEQNKLKREAEKLKLEQELENNKRESELIAQEGHLGNNIDFVANNQLDDGFSPLDLSQVVRTKMNE